MTPLKIICGCGHTQQSAPGQVHLSGHDNYEDKDRAPKDRRRCELPLSRT